MRDRRCRCSTPRADHKQGCCSAADAADARRVADRLDIPFYALNLQEEFGRIIDYFVDEYVRGRTPNPCVVCNHWLKFGKLFDYADSVDAEYVATGHYARCTRAADGTTGLCRGVDLDKDQSYVLFGIQPRASNACCCRSARIASRRSAVWRRHWDCAWPTSATARRSVSSPTASTPSSCERGAASATRPAAS